MEQTQYGFFKNIEVTNGAMHTLTSSLIPSAFNKHTFNSGQFDVLQGGLNKLVIRPQILNEQQEQSGEIVSIVTSANTVGQIFQASQDNVNGIVLTLESAETFGSMDTLTAGVGELKAGTMEYTSSAAMQAEYIGATPAIRNGYIDNANVTQDGSWALEMDTTILGDFWEVALTSSDLTGHSFKLKFAQTDTFARINIFFYITDGVNSKSFPLTVSAKKLWQEFTIPEINMTVTANDMTAVAPTMGAIIGMGFRVDTERAGKFAYVDSITHQIQPYSMSLELWDFGMTLPASGGTLDYTTGATLCQLGDEGLGGGFTLTNSIDIDLIGGKRLYNINHYIAGANVGETGNILLVPGHYYGIIMNYVDTNVKVYGKSNKLTTNTYNNGYAWAADSTTHLVTGLTGLTGTGINTAFEIFSTQDCYITSVGIFANAVPGPNSSITIQVENQYEQISDIITKYDTGGYGNQSANYNLGNSPLFIAKGSKIEGYLHDDATDDMTKVLLNAGYFFTPPTTNG